MKKFRLKTYKKKFLVDTITPVGVYLRIREKLYDEKFPLDNTDLYPGDYLKDIANSIIKNNKDINFENFKDIEVHLKKLSINESLNK